MNSKDYEKKEEKYIIDKIANNIEVISNKNINNSIYKVYRDIYYSIKSEYFTMDSLLPVLEQHNEEGIIDYLINLMTSKFLDESFFYISQLIVLTFYKLYKDSLEKYIIDRCLNEIKFSIKITLLLKSFKSSPEIEKLLYVIDSMLITKNWPLRDSKNNMIFTYKLGSDYIISNPNFINTEVYFYYKCLGFYDNLRNLCLLLFQYPIKEEEKSLNRKNVLNEFIKLINEELNNMRKENYLKMLKTNKNLEISNKNSSGKNNNSKEESTKKSININEENQKNKNSFILNEDSTLSKNCIYHKGYLLPFNRTLSNLDPHSLIILNIIPEHSFCFNTKERVPIKLCCECIEISECENFYNLYDDNEFFNVIDNESIVSTNDFLSQQSALERKKIFDKWKELEKFLQDKEIITNEEVKKEDTNDLIEDKVKEFIVVDYNLDALNPFGEPVEKINEKIKEKSKFKNFKTYKIKNFIAKANDDLKQEMFALQMIKKFQEILSQIGIFVKSYEIITTSENSGLMDFLSNTNSIDGILKSIPSKWKLNQFFRNYFKKNLKEAQKNFAESLAGFCIVSYFLQIKDRHNGNIMLDNKGHIFHIDFGFILGSSPKNLGFEKPHFKLVKDYVDILDGLNSEIFEYFKNKFVEGIIECKKHHQILSSIIRIMYYAGIKCFEGKQIDNILKDFQQKFLFKYSEKEIKDHVNKMINDCYNNFFTNKYDYFQYFTNNISY